MPAGVWLYSYLALWGLLLVETVVLIAVIRQLAILHSHWVANEPDWGLPLGAPAPSLGVDDLSGKPAALATARGRKTLLYFLSPGCSSCRGTLPFLGAIGRIPGVEMIIVVSGSTFRIEEFAEAIRQNTTGLEFPIVSDEQHELMDRYNVSAVPYAVVVDEEGKIGAKGSVVTQAEVEALFLYTDERRRVLPEGDAAERSTAHELPARDREPVEA